MNAAVFLDRDGTLIEEREYLSRPEQVVLLPGVAAALGALAGAGFRLIVVTNQSGVGRGYFTLGDVEAVHTRLERDLAEVGVRLDAIYIAPEAPGQPSVGRKPSPHFLLQARTEHAVDLGRSYMIGDKLIDLECGWNAGVRRSILVRTGYGAAVAALPADQLRDAWVVEGLGEAAARILAESDDGKAFS